MGNGDAQFIFLGTNPSQMIPLGYCSYFSRVAFGNTQMVLVTLLFVTVAVTCHKNKPMYTDILNY